MVVDTAEVVGYTGRTGLEVEHTEADRIGSVVVGIVVEEPAVGIEAVVVDTASVEVVADTGAAGHIEAVVDIEFVAVEPAVVAGKPGHQISMEEGHTSEDSVTSSLASMADILPPHNHSHHLYHWIFCFDYFLDHEPIWFCPCCCKQSYQRHN